MLLLLTLAITPLRRMTGWAWLVRLRRMLGLFAFFYGTLHLTAYVWFDQFFDWPAIVKDVAKRPFSRSASPPRADGAAGADLDDAMIRRLGGALARLHRLVYAVGVLGVLHFWWHKPAKNDLAEPTLYAPLWPLLGAVARGCGGACRAALSRVRQARSARRATHALALAHQVRAPAVDHHLGGARPRVVVRAHRHAVGAGGQ